MDATASRSAEFARARPKQRLALAVLALIAAWAAAYFAWPRVSFDDGPFHVEPFTGDVAVLSPVSFVDLKFFSTLRFVLETRSTPGPKPATVFVLTNPDRSLRWAKSAPARFGVIRLVDQSAHWFLPGGWVATIKPQDTESGELYLSAFGEFRFFFHSW